MAGASLTLVLSGVQVGSQKYYVQSLGSCAVGQDLLDLVVESVTTGPLLGFGNFSSVVAGEKDEVV